MNKQQTTQLLKMYELLLDQVEHFYDQGSPAVETSACEAKIEQMKAVLTVLNVPFKE